MLGSMDLAEVVEILSTAIRSRPASPYPMNFKWTNAMDLDDVALRDREVMHPFRQKNVRSRSHILTSMRVELVTNSQAPNSRKYGDVFIDRMPMRRKLSTRCRPNAKHKWRSRL